MMNDARQKLFDTLSAILTLAPEMRFGQLMATLGFLAEDASEHTIWEIEDVELLRVLERHRAELAARQSIEVEPTSAKGH
jgi:hypothetical protein